MVIKITSKESAQMFLSLYSLLSKCKGAAPEYERSCGCFVLSTWSAAAHNLFQWRLRRHHNVTTYHTLSMIILSMICGRHCTYHAANNNHGQQQRGWERPCEFFQESDNVTCHWRKREQITHEREQFGKHCHSSRREEVLWNRGLRWAPIAYRLIRAALTEFFFNDPWLF